MTASTSSVPDTWRVSTPPISSSPSSLASPSQVRGSSPSARSEPRLRMFFAMARLALRTSAGGLLVVDVLELDEGPVAGGEEARLDRLARRRRRRCAGRCRPKAACPCWCETGRLASMRTGCPAEAPPLRSSSASTFRSALLDLVLEGLVEQVLDALLVLAAAASQLSASAANSSRAARRRTRRRIVGARLQLARLDRNPSPSSCCRLRCGRSSGQSWSRSRPSLLAAARPGGEVILVEGDRAVRVNDPAVPSKAEIALWRCPDARWHERRAAARRAAASSRRATGALCCARCAARTLDGARRAALAALVRQLAAHIPRASAGARRDQLGYVIDSVEALALGRRLEPARACRPRSCSSSETAATGARSLPRLRRPGELPRQRGALPVLPGPRAAAPAALDLQEGQPHARRLRARRAGVRQGRPAPAARRDGARWPCARSRRFIAWEYAFDFGGGSPPWMSGMAQATGDPGAGARGQAARRARATSRSPARRSAPSRRRRRPACARPGPAAASHYLQYSFAPRLYIFNAFLQSLIGLHDFGKLAGDDARYRAVSRG